MALPDRSDHTTEPTPVESAGTSSWAKWATVVIVGEVCLFALFLVVGGWFHAFNLGTYLAAVGVATFVGGRLGGLQGVGQWLSAAIVIVLVSIAIAYLLVLAVVSQIQGP